MKPNILKLKLLSEDNKKARIITRNGTVLVCDLGWVDDEGLRFDVYILESSDTINYPLYDEKRRTGMTLDDSDIASVEEYTNT